MEAALIIGWLIPKPRAGRHSRVGWSTSISRFEYPEGDAMTLSFQPCNESATATDVECDCGWFGHFADVADARAESEVHRCPADIATSSDSRPADV